MAEGRQEEFHVGDRAKERRQPAGAGAMLVAYRLAGLSALEGHYAALNALPQ